MVITTMKIITLPITIKYQGNNGSNGNNNQPNYNQNRDSLNYNGSRYKNN